MGPFSHDDLSPTQILRALQLGEIDAAIAAISVTPQRQAVLDFSGVYFVGEDGILAREGSDITAIVAIDDLSALRIGAQRMTVYEDWLQTELVDTDRLPADNLLVYEDAGDAVADLRESRLDSRIEAASTFFCRACRGRSRRSTPRPMWAE